MTKEKVARLVLQFILLFSAIPSVAYSQAYIEVGVGAVLDNTPGHCISQLPGNNCSQNPIGLAAIGYQFGNFLIELEHKSALTEKDRGLDTVFVKYRYTFSE